MKYWISLFVVVVAWIGLQALCPALAEARGVICEHVQDEMFSVDGMKDDWEGSRSTRFGGGADVELNLYCAYDRTRLYLLYDVKDERVVRTRRAAKASEDRVSVILGISRAKSIRFSVLPGGESVARKALKKPSFVELEDSLQEGGFTVEMSMPLAKIPGWAETIPFLRGKLLFHDVDSAGRGKVEKVVGMRGKLHFADAVQSYFAFMKQTGLRSSDLRLDRLVDMDPGVGPERILIGKSTVGLLTTGYSYMNLPIASPEDLLSAKVVDFDNSGRYALVTELRQHGNGGSRDVVIVWVVKSGGSFQPVLTFETRKEYQGMVMKNDWQLVPRGQYRQSDDPKKKRKKPRALPGNDILVRVGSVTGFSAENYREAPAPDAKAILTPWGEQQSAVYYLEGGVGYGGLPAVE